MVELNPADKIERESTSVGSWFPVDFNELPVRMNSKSEIVSAGKVLREHLSIDSFAEIEEKRGVSVLDAFKIAHAWRDAHMYPLLKVRRELGGRLRSIEKGAISAARLKRMESIRKKLQRPITLYQMQDIAGCRAVLRSIKEVDRLVAFYKQGESKHAISDEDDYITSPKQDGYRSHHIILKFHGIGADEIYNRQNVELQIRTRAQHSWATAVEAVGLIRHENIKGGEGNEDWRRFFELMSSVIASDEGRPVCPSANLQGHDLHKELKEISKKIKAVSVLETYNKAIKFADNYGDTYSKYYLLQFDYKTKEVSVEPFRRYEIGAARYIEEEKINAQKNSVLVEVNKVADLQKAFPNYFLDVREFTDRVRRIIQPGYGTIEKYDLSWLKGYR